jgi:bifunctional UDP-N-acetylglucosamine pyrophosphorylase/glucosamine-1-phosphate N-acetyltransferase
MQAITLQAIVLAAGKSSRFKTGISKLQYTVCGQPLLLYPLKVLQRLSIPTILVLGYQKDTIHNLLTNYSLSNLTWVEQPEPKGTGDAVQCALPNLTAEHILILNGDVPLLTTELVEELIHQHLETNAALSFITAHNADPALQGYGRVTQEEGKLRIVEARNLKNDIPTSDCVNAGIYLVKRVLLQEALSQVKPNVITQEIYLTDIIEILSNQEHKITTITALFDTIRGVNTFKELWAVEQIKRSELIGHWMDQGVHFTSPHNVHIDCDVSLGSGTQVGAGVILLKGTTVGAHCSIGPYSVIGNSVFEDGVTILSHCVINDSKIKSQAQIGPFAHLRRNVLVGKKSVIGNFVEATSSTIGDYAKAKHLSYIGNAHIGSHANIGAGTITCNYDGSQKHVTHIGEHAHIGSNNSLVAPVHIGSHAVTGAGSVITEDVPAQSLALARSRQINKLNYAKKYTKNGTTSKDDVTFLTATKATEPFPSQE